MICKLLGHRMKMGHIEMDHAYTGYLEIWFCQRPGCPHEERVQIPV